jgi:hypothetical protein
VQEVLSVSERRACRAIGQARSSHRYQTEKPDQDRPLLERMVVLARENPRYGYRRIWALLRSSGATSLRREGWRVNPGPAGWAGRKRVHWLWRAEGLKVPVSQHKRRRLGSSDNSSTRKRAEHPNHVWSLLRGP